MQMPTPSTFAFSDEELLDALRQFDVAEISSGASASGSTPTATGSAANMPVASTVNLHDMPSFTSQLSEVMPVRDLSDAAAPSGDAAPGARPTRKRRKHELDAMRALATSLETQLHELKKRHRKENAGKNVFWKHVADHLLLDKQRAVNENARLREVFSDQAKVLKSIQRTLHKSPGMERLGDVVTTPTTAVVPAANSPESVDQVFQQLAVAYEGTESIMQQAGLPRAYPCEEARRMNMEVRTEHGRSVMCTQVAESKTLPFDVGQVVEGVWRFLVADPSGGDGEAIFQRRFSAKGDGMFGVTKIDISLGLYCVEVDVGLRRFVESSRVTIVWEGMGSCRSERCPANSFKLREKGWAVFEPSRVDLGKSVFRACVQFIPSPADGSQDLSADAKDIGLITELTMTMYEQTIGCVYDTVLAELNKMTRATE